MPGTNEYLPFADASGANVIDQATYSALAARLTGFASGTALSEQVNKVLKQAAVMAAAVGQLIANSGQNALDSDTPAALATKLLTAIQGLLTPQCPIGSIVAWPVGAAPANWLECNGSIADRSDYPALFGVIGTSFGGGDNTGLTFNLPDYRGMFMRGWDHMRGIDYLRSLNTFQDYATAPPQNKNVEHLSPELGTIALVDVTNPSTVGFARACKAGEDVTIGDVDALQGTNGETDCYNVVTGDSETRPKNMSVMYIIRYQ